MEQLPDVCRVAPLIRGVRMSGFRESQPPVRPITDGNDLLPILSGHDERFGPLVWWARPALHNLQLLSAASGARQLGKSELSGMAARSNVFRLAVPLIRNPRMNGAPGVLPDLMGFHVLLDKLISWYILLPISRILRRLIDMKKPRGSSAGFGLLLLTVTLLAWPNSGLSQATNFDQNGLATIDFPITGVQLGQGIDLITGVPKSTCVEGAARGVTGATAKTPQVVSVSLRNNKDASTYLQEINVSASAQANFLAGHLSAKMTYVTKHQFEQTTDTISIYERAEQHEYLAPASGAAAPVEVPGQRVNTTALNGIQLNQRALRFLTHRPPQLDQFQRECGAGFAAVLIEGGELIATLTVIDHKATDSNSLDSSFGFSAVGGNVNTTVQTAVNQASTGHDVSFDFLTSGGSGDPVPINEETLLNKVQSLPHDVSNAPIPFQVVVRSYQSLPNFPTQIPPFGRPQPLDNIMATYWRLDAVLNQAVQTSQPFPQQIFGLPFPFPNQPQSYLMGFNTAFPDEINNTIDQLIAKRRTLADQALACFNNQNCGMPIGTPVVSQIELYSLAARLPLPISAGTANMIQYQQVLTTLRSAANIFNVAKSRAVANALGAFGKGPGPEPNCAAQNRSVVRELESQHNSEEFFAAFATADQFIENSAPSLLRDDAVDFYVRRPVRARCALSPFDLACTLTEQDFAGINQGIPLKAGVQIKPQSDPNHINDWDPCPFMNPAGPPLPLAGFILVPKP